MKKPKTTHRVVVAVGFAAALVAGTAHADTLAALLKNKKVKAALASMGASKETLVAEWVKLAETSAPSKHEDARAEHMLGRFRELGLDDVHRDSIGNVVGTLRGTAPSEKFIVFDAHLDTVVKPGTEVKVRREGGEPGKLYGAGVGDDTAGLIGLLYTVKALREHDVRLRENVVFVASVQEEIGLLGATRFIEENAAKVNQYVSVDGSLGTVSYGATNIVWRKFHFKSEGAHTLSSYGKASTTHAAARAVADLYAFPLPREPEEKKTWLNVGMMGAGEVVNAQSRDTWFTVDMRSNSRDVIAEMEKKVNAVTQNAADLLGVTMETEEIQRMEGIQLPGHKDSEFVQTALAVLKAVGVKEPKASMLGSSNHNAALLKNIPGINVGVTNGEGAHTPTEWAEIDPMLQGVKQLILLAGALAGT